MTPSGQRSISVSSRHFAGHRTVRGARSAIVLGVALLTALVMVPVAGASSTSPVLKSSGPAGEGPYPWAYPASGDIKAGTGTTSSGAQVHAVDSTVRLAVRPTVRPEVHRQ